MDMPLVADIPILYFEDYILADTKGVGSKGRKCNDVVALCLPLLTGLLGARAGSKCRARGVEAR